MDVWMWELDHKEGWELKNWCFWTVVLEKTLESPLDCKNIKPVNPKGNQPWIFIGRTDAEAEAPIVWPPDAKSWLIGKDCGAGKDGGQEEKGTTEDEMVGWQHRLDGHEFKQAPGVGEGQNPILACCSLWGHRESDTTEWLKDSKNCCCLVTKSCPRLCEPMDCSTPGFLVLCYLKFAQTHVHWVGDDIQPSHPLSFPFPLTFNFSQHQGLFHWLSSLHRVDK